jgi:hypothetical protein
MTTKSEEKSSNSKDQTRLEKAVHAITLEMATRPIVWCSCMTSFVLFLVVILVAANLASMSENSSYDWTIASTEESRNLDALTGAISDVDKLDTVVGYRTQVYTDYLTFSYHSQSNDDLFTAKYLQGMCKIESAFVLDEQFPNYCQLNANNTCILPYSSLVVYFYDFQSFDEWNCTLLSNETVFEKSDYIYSQMGTPKGQERYGYWLDKKSVSRGYTTMAQSLWSLGAPLDNYESITAKSDKQVELQPLYHFTRC